MADSKLFSGRIEPMGGLSNENELAKECPADFKNSHNPWTNYACHLFFEGANIGNWKWKSTDKKEKSKQLKFLHGLLSGFGLGHAEKEAVAGWMLSEMLSEVPEHVPS